MNYISHDPLPLCAFIWSYWSLGFLCSNVRCILLIWFSVSWSYSVFSKKRKIKLLCRHFSGVVFFPICCFIDVKAEFSNVNFSLFSEKQNKMGKYELCKNIPTWQAKDVLLLMNLVCWVLLTIILSKHKHDGAWWETNVKSFQCTTVDLLLYPTVQ